MHALQHTVPPVMPHVLQLYTVMEWNFSPLVTQSHTTVGPDGTAAPRLSLVSGANSAPAGGPVSTSTPSGVRSCTGATTLAITLSKSTSVPDNVTGCTCSGAGASPLRQRVHGHGKLWEEPADGSSTGAWGSTSPQNRFMGGGAATAPAPVSALPSVDRRTAPTSLPLADGNSVRLQHEQYVARDDHSCRLLLDDTRCTSLASLWAVDASSTHVPSCTAVDKHDKHRERENVVRRPMLVGASASASASAPAPAATPLSSSDADGARENAVSCFMAAPMSAWYASKSNWAWGNDTRPQVASVHITTGSWYRVLDSAYCATWALTAENDARSSEDGVHHDEPRASAAPSTANAASRSTHDNTVHMAEDAHAVSSASAESHTASSGTPRPAWPASGAGVARVRPHSCNSALNTPPRSSSVRVAELTGRRANKCSRS